MRRYRELRKGVDAAAKRAQLKHKLAFELDAQGDFWKSGCAGCTRAPLSRLVRF